MVEWKKLGEVCEVLRGKRLTKSQLSETDGYPVLHGGSTPMGYYSEFNRKANTTVVVNTGNAGSVFFYDKKFWSSDACFSLYPNDKILDKFLYLYVYGCEHILKGKIRAGAMPTIDAIAVESLLIPIPTLSEQELIVGILDTFTGSIENLKGQIAQRRKQYEHYRDQLLDLEGKPGVEWKMLVSISDVLYGYPFDSSLFTENSDYMPLIRIRDIMPSKASTFYSGKILEEYRIKKGDILVGMDGEFNLARWDDRDGLLNQRVLKLKGKKDICLDGYLFHYMRPVFKKIEKETAGGSVKHLSAKTIKAISIPLPSLAEQERIVSILDTFEASIQNLEAQLKEREKQYEFYRQRLLSFERPG